MRGLVEGHRGARGRPLQAELHRPPGLQVVRGRDGVAAAPQRHELQHGIGRRELHDFQPEPVLRIPGIGPGQVGLQHRQRVAIEPVARLESLQRQPEVARGDHRPLPAIGQAVAIRVFAQGQVDPGRLRRLAQQGHVGLHLDGQIGPAGDLHPDAEGRGWPHGRRAIQVGGQAGVHRHLDAVVHPILQAGDHGGGDGGAGQRLERQLGAR